MHKVEEAAERNIPIESMYERSHEIKDERPPKTSIITGLSAAASSIAGTYDKLRQLYGQRVKTAAAALKVQPTPKPSTDRGLYKQAAQSGFWTGLVLCIFLLIMLITH